MCVCVWLGGGGGSLRRWLDPTSHRKEATYAGGRRPRLLELHPTTLARTSMRAASAAQRSTEVSEPILSLCMLVSRTFDSASQCSPLNCVPLALESELECATHQSK